ncbi:MAG: glycosyltransferase sugar-binding region containing motif [Acidimicrobiales bacterium]|nr:glycosyltransferase sugar-binding region containing motif [Acidimicrobiales bacterium]
MSAPIDADPLASAPVTNGNDPQAVFEQIYATAHWESGSGQGSRPDVTEVYRQVVERAISGRDVRTVVDAGCGDWEFARLIDWSGVSYVGVDVVPEVIERNQRELGRDGVSFACLDLHRELPPPADLLICKDVLQHWPAAWVRHFLEATRGRYRYRLITNDIASNHWPSDQLNAEIALGAWRTLDLERPEFGVAADWRLDFDVRSEWTKRILLLVDDGYRARAARRPGSLLRRLRRMQAPPVPSPAAAPAPQAHPQPDTQPEPKPGESA